MPNPWAFVGIRGAPASLSRGKKKKQQYHDQRYGKRGRWVSPTEGRRQAELERYFRSELGWGSPGAGKTWVTISSKYPERFEEYMPE